MDGVFKVTMYELGTTPSGPQWFLIELGLGLGLGLEPMPVVLAAPTLAIRREKRSISKIACARDV